MNADANGNPDFDNPEPPAPADMVDHPPHYNTDKFPHTQCGAPIEVIDITRRLDFCLGNSVKYILRAGHKGSTIEDLRKAKRYIEYAIEDAEAEQETAEILKDPATMEAIRQGEQDFDFKHERDLYAEEWAQNLADPETMGDLRAKGWAQNLADKREWPGVISVQYTPTGPDDPWQAMMWSEETNGLLSFDELKQVVVMQLGMGHPDGVHLKVKGVPWFVDGHALVAEVVGPGQSLELVRKPTVLAGDFPVYDPNAIGHYAFPVEPLRAIPADEVPSANRDRTQL